MSLNLWRKVDSARWYLRANLALRRARRDGTTALRNAQPSRILVVCHGNIYRSAFVAALLRQHVGDKFDVRSAGFHAEAGRSSPERHIRMSREVGVNLEQHRSTVVRATDLAWADVIVLMDRKNWVQLRRIGAPIQKLVWLGAWDPSGTIEIEDPHSMNDIEAAELLQRIARCTAAFEQSLARVREAPKTNLYSRVSQR